MRLHRYWVWLAVAGLVVGRDGTVVEDGLVVEAGRAGRDICLPASYLALTKQFYHNNQPEEVTLLTSHRQEAR